AGASGGDDTITTGGGTNIILGGLGGDTITLGGGTNTVVGDQGIVSRSDANTITRVATTGTAGARDVIRSTGGTNIILGGAGNDEIHADAGASSNVILGDNGVANFGLDGWDIRTSDDTAGGDDIITGGANNTILGGIGTD